MKKILFFFCLPLTLFLSLAGCSVPDYEGYVTDKRDGSILVVASDVEGANGNGNAEYHRALWGMDAPTDIEVGQKVEVWVGDHLMESDPVQGEIKEINVTSKEKPANADITEAEAIRRAFKQVEERRKPLKEVEKEKEMSIVKSTQFDQEADKWVIKIESKIGEEKASYNLRINDH